MRELTRWARRLNSKYSELPALPGATKPSIGMARSYKSRSAYLSKKFVNLTAQLLSLDT
jgi:hypothetical protein